MITNQGPQVKLREHEEFLNRLHKSLDSLDTSVETLRNAVSPITVQLKPSSDVEVNGKDSETRSLLFKELDKAVDKLNRLIKQMDYITENIEL